MSFMLHKKKTARLLASAAVLPMMVASAATAQEAEEATDVEEIVVSGFRGSLHNALEAKRDATTVKDDIFAEDMGKFPDMNLAEAIQRVSGVAIRRDNGEGVSVELRGLGSQYTNTTLHGMSIATAANTSRGSSLDLFPSELFTRITIEKSATASQIEGGIAGSIDMRNARPFDFDEELQINTSLQGGYNTQSGKFDPRGHVMVSKTWDAAGGRFGLLGGVAYSKRYVRVDGWESQDWGSRAAGVIRGFDFQDGNRSGLQSSVYDTGIWNDPINQMPDPDNIGEFLDPEGQIPDDHTSGALEQVKFARLQRTDFIYGDRNRLGAVVAAQWEPNEELTVSFDWLHSELDDITYRENLDVEVRNSRETDPVNIVADENGYLLTGTLENVNRRSESRQFFDYQTFDQFIAEADWQASEKLRVQAKFGYNTSNYKQRMLTMLSTAKNTAATFDYSVNSDIPSVLSNVDLLDSANYEFDLIRAQPRDRNTDNKNFNIDFTYGDDVQNIRFGAAYAEFKFSELRYDRNKSPAEFADQWTGGVVPTVEQATMPLPFDDYSSNFDTPEGAVTNWLVADWDQLESMTKNGLDTLVVSGFDPDQVSPFVKEKTLALYTEINSAGDFLGSELRMNAGFRAIQTTQATRYGKDSEYTIEIDRKYWDYLPSFNLAWDAAEDVVVRLAAGRAMTRPSLGELEGNVGFNSAYEVSGDNPYLNPYFSNQVDAGAEWYFAEDSALSFNLFYKDIAGFLERSITDGTFAESGLDVADLDSDIFAGVTNNTPVTFIVDENSPENRVLKGLEIGFQMPFDELISIPGFGMMANYTYVVSGDVTYDTSAGPILTSVVGLSNHIYNLVGYYENDVYSVRASWNYRSSFTQSGCCRNSQPLLRVRDGRGQLDLSASYNINDAMTVSFEALNMTNAEQYTGFGQRLNRVINTGRQFFVGMRANF